MIWVGGEILPDDGLTINAADRTFEHGLGLFETLRTWGGRPSLLDAHRARMLRSAEELGIPIDPATLPVAEDVARLLHAEQAPGDRMIRITSTGGGPDPAGPVVWMRTHPLPPPTREVGAKVLGSSWMVARDDPIARHKALNYWSRRLAFEKAKAKGFDEVLSMTPGWVYWEGSRSNLFVVEGDRLLTPSLDGPIVPGVMRRLVLDLSWKLDLKVEEVHGIEGRQFLEADEVFLTNAVRGIMPVSRAVGHNFPPNWEAPGPWTRSLQDEVSRHLRPDRGETL